MRLHAPLGIVTILASALFVPAATSYAGEFVCGNGIVEGFEECDPPGSLTCGPDGSPDGAFALGAPTLEACNADCTCPDGEEPSSPAGSFLCYGLKTGVGASESDVELTDRFGDVTVDLEKRRRLCAPANVDDEDPEAPEATDHLTEYIIRGRTPFQSVRNQQVVNQFGTVFVDVLRRKSLLVPTEKSLEGDQVTLQGAAPSGETGHFACYAVKRTRGTPPFQRQRDVTVETQFESVVIDVRRPRQLCVPADKNGEDPGAEENPGFLLCYMTKGRGGIGRPRAVLTDQFGTVTVTVNQRQLLCVASQESTPTTTTTVTTTTTTTTSTIGTTTTSVTVPTTTSTTMATTTTSTTTSTTTTTTMPYGSPTGALLTSVADLLD